MLRASGYCRTEPSYIPKTRINEELDSEGTSQLGLDLDVLTPAWK